LKLLITGSGTLLGNTLVLRALKKKYKIIASYRKSFPKNLKKKDVSLIKIDLEKKIKPDCKIDCLIHCASAIPSDNLSDKKMMKINYIGFKELSLKLIANGCKKIIFISSMSVYGNIDDRLVDLNTKTNPVDVYGQSKLKVEKFLEKLKKEKNIDYFILRLPALVGKNSDYNFISKILKKIKKNEIVSYSNPNLKFNNFIHVNNLVSIIMRMIKLPDCKILNIASLRPVKLKNIINLIYLFEKKKNNSIIKNSKNKGFNIKIDSYLKKNFKIFSTNQTLTAFLKDNKN
tara:strand:+ start:1859 stop:2722 length:864 start_codon:yes stop_codon:yes gene_type:complete